MKGLSGVNGCGLQLRLEALEERIAPAGAILAEIRGGNLVITGDADANDIVIDNAGLAAGQVRLTSGADATEINGGVGPVILDGFTRGIAMKMGDGDDSVDLDGLDIDGGVAADMGDGADALAFDLTVVHGNLKVKMGDGDDFFGTELSFFDNLKVDMGDGENDIVVNDSQLLGTASFKAGFGGDTFVLHNTATDKTLSVDMGNGDAGININDSVLGNTGRGYGTKITVGTGDVVMDLTNIPNAHDFTYAQRGGTLDAGIDGALFNGNLKMTTGNVDSVTVLTDTEVTHALAIKGGFGSMQVAALGLDAGTSARGDAAIISHVGGLGDVALEGTTFGGNLTIAGGREGGMEFTDTDTTIGGNLTFKGTSDADLFSLIDALVGGKTSVNGGSGNDVIHLNAAGLLRALTINAGNGDDDVLLDSYDNEPLGAPSFFDGAVKILLGSGDDYLTAGVGDAGDEAIFGSSVLANGGSGDDTLDYLTGDQTFAVEPKVVGFETTI